MDTLGAVDDEEQIVRPCAAFEPRGELKRREPLCCMRSEFLIARPLLIRVLKPGLVG